MDAKYYTVRELVEKETLPEIYDLTSHLIYSSPATLAYNSPGAQGFGVKRAGLAVPESIMLIVAPGCCGRNTSAILEMPQYKNRFFYYLLDETDIVTGRHLKKIPEAVKEIVDSIEVKPEIVMICITCVDALLGTDMEAVCAKASEYADIRVKPCYMYALTREGRKPPMVHVQESLYSLLEPLPKENRTVNLIGHYAHLRDTSELYDYLLQLGITTIHEISRKKTYKEFLEMGHANFNILLHPDARVVAKDMEKRLNMGSIELTRTYRINQVHRQYQAFANVFQTTINDTKEYEELKNYIKTIHPQRVAVGETLNGDPIDISIALLEYGYEVPVIYCTLTPLHQRRLQLLYTLSPDTRIYCNNEPSMMYYEMSDDVDITVGKDASYYYPHLPSIPFNEDVQPFGYDGIHYLLELLEEAYHERTS